MAEKLKINVSFPQYDKHIYDYIKSQPNPSAFLRKLVEGYMDGTIVKVTGGQMVESTIAQIVPVSKTTSELMVSVVEKEEKVEEVKEEVETVKDRIASNIVNGEFKTNYDLAVNDLTSIDNLPF